MTRNKRERLSDALFKDLLLNQWRRARELLLRIKSTSEFETDDPIVSSIVYDESETSPERLEYLAGFFFDHVNFHNSFLEEDVDVSINFELMLTFYTMSTLCSRRRETILNERDFVATILEGAEA